MTIEVGLGLLAAAIPLTALILRFSGCVSPVEFVKLKTEFEGFRDEVRLGLTKIEEKLERYAK